MEREAKDHAPLIGNDLRNILERKNQEPSALPACADDEVAGAILVPAELLDYAEQPLRRFDTEAHALGQVATKPLSPWCCSAPSFHPTPFPASGEAERLMKPTGWLPPSQFGVAPPPKALALVRLAEGAFFPPIFRARPERTTSVRLPDKWVKSRFRKLRLFKSGRNCLTAGSCRERVSKNSFLA